MERYRSYWKCWHCRGERKPITEAELMWAPVARAEAPALAEVEISAAGSRGAAAAAGAAPAGRPQASHAGPCEARGPEPPAPVWERGVATLEGFLSFLHRVPGKRLAEHRSCSYASMSISKARDYHLKHLNLCYFESAIIPALTMTDQCAVSD